MNPKYNDDDTVTISIDDYSELVRDSKFLSALGAAGVDNWDGYDFALDMMEDDDNE